MTGVRVPHPQLRTIHHSTERKLGTTLLKVGEKSLALPRSQHKQVYMGEQHGQGSGNKINDGLDKIPVMSSLHGDYSSVG